MLEPLGPEGGHLHLPVQSSDTHVRDGRQEGLGERLDKGKPSTSVVSLQSSRPCSQPYARPFSSIRHGDNSDVKTAYKTAQESGLEMTAGRSHQSGSSREKTASHQPALRCRQSSSRGGWAWQTQALTPGRPWRLNRKEPACSSGDPGSISGSGRSPGAGKGSPCKIQNG